MVKVEGSCDSLDDLQKDAPDFLSDGQFNSCKGEGALVHVLTWYANRHRSKAGYRPFALAS